MKKDEFIEITSTLINEITDDMIDKGLSPQTALSGTLTMGLFAAKLSERLYDCDDLEIER